MKRFSLGILVLAIALAATATLASAQATPEFKLGFKALADQVPQVVGLPLENEHWGANGDSLQQTTTGLMVWRKADNWTAFTNGSRTWVNLPGGARERGNDERFPEEASVPATPQPLPTPSPAPPAPTPVTLPRYSPEVKTMDEQSSGPGATVSAFVREVESEWANNWGWRPTRPLTVYLFWDGNRLADYFASIRGRPLTDVEKANMPNSSVAWGNDTQTKGWAILLNLSRAYGTANWDPVFKSSFARAYSEIMLGDLVTWKSPKWFRNGFVDLLAFTKVPATTADDYRVRLLARYRDAGRLPTLRYMNDNFDSMVAAGGESAALAWGMGDLAVSFLADRIGGRGLMDLEKRVGTGDNFEAALQAMTGYTIESLDLEYRAKIPR